MAHFAEIDENNIVIRVLVTDNNSTNEGYDWLIETFGGRWFKTSYNATIRKHFAGIGYAYDETLDAFIPPKPFESWILNNDTCNWEPPTQYPADGLTYFWNEDNIGWELSDFSQPADELES
jgi:hypothetical protein